MTDGPISHISWRQTYISEYGDISSLTNIEWSTNTEVLESWLPELSLPGMTFLGWYSSETFEEDTKINVGDILLNASVVPVYAKWEGNPIIVDAMAIYDIANAIRERGKTTGGIALKDMAAAVTAALSS